MRTGDNGEYSTNTLDYNHVKGIGKHDGENLEGKLAKNENYGSSTSSFFFF